MSHAATASHANAKADAPQTKAAAKPRDAADDQLKLLLLLATDWLDGDREHAEEIAELVTALTPPPAA